MVFCYVRVCSWATLCKPDRNLEPTKARYKSQYQLYYRGFKSKPGVVRIITFRVITRLYSKLNRCIWYTTLIVWLLTRPGSSNIYKLLFCLVQNVFTWHNWNIYQLLLLTMGVTVIKKSAVMGIFKFVWHLERKCTVFNTTIIVPKSHWGTIWSLTCQNVF